MNAFCKITLALLAAAFVSSTPAIAAETTVPASAQKPSLSEALKSKAGDVISEAQQGVDEKAAKLKDALGVNKKQKAATPRTMEKNEVMGEAAQGTDTKGAQIKDTTSSKLKDTIDARKQKNSAPRTVEKNDVMGEAAQGTDTKGAQIKDTDGKTKRSCTPSRNATAPVSGKSAAAKDEIVQVEQETVTVETPDGVAQETVTTVTPESPANARDALKKAAKDAVNSGKDAAKDAIKDAVKGAAGK